MRELPTTYGGEQLTARLSQLQQLLPGLSLPSMEDTTTLSTLQVGADLALVGCAVASNFHVNFSTIKNLSCKWQYTGSEQGLQTVASLHAYLENLIALLPAKGGPIGAVSNVHLALKHLSSLLNCHIRLRNPW